MTDGLCEEGFEEILATSGGTEEDEQFDKTVGALQEILLDESFHQVHDDFLNKHYHHFEDKDENKHIYMDIFTSYTALIEQHLERELSKRIPNFKMDAFLGLLEMRRSEIDEMILDILSSFSDFQMFKQTFITYRKEKEGQGVGLTVSTSSMSTRPEH